jgi:hypothetical protein
MDGKHSFNNHPGLQSLDVNVNWSESKLEYEAHKGAFPAWGVNELGIVDTYLKNPPPFYEQNRSFMRAAGPTGKALMMWRKNEPLDDRLIVVIDRKCRIAAIGYPFAQQTMIIERLAGDLIIAHEVPNCIVSEGMWSMLMMVAEVNSSEGWGQTSGMTVAGLFRTVHQVSERWDATA